MNMLLIIVIVIFLVFIIMGYIRGLFRSVFKLILTGLSFLLAYFSAPLVSGLLAEHTNLDEYIQGRIYQQIKMTVEERVAEELSAAIGYADTTLVEQVTSEIMSTELNRSDQVSFIYESGFPSFVKDALMSHNNDETRTELGVENFYDYISIYIAYMIMNVITFFVVSLLLRIIFGIISMIIEIAIQIPIVSSINRLGGALFGAVEGLLIVWFFFVIVSVLINTAWGIQAYAQIEENQFLSLLYEKNVFLSFVTKLKIGANF